MVNSRINTVGNKSFIWLLVIAVLVMAFFPVHYHFHHLDLSDLDGHAHHSVDHEHKIDLHLLMDKHDMQHHDIDATSFTAVPDDAIKSLSFVKAFILLALVLAVMPAVQQLVTIAPKRRNAARKRRRPHFIPQLRAPPLS